MVVIKRDKTEENFDVTKIEKAISKAFKACGKKPNYSVIDCVRETYDIDSDEKVDVEMIQDTIEKCLMDIDKDVAKAYIIYRNERAKARDFKYNKKYYTTILELLNGKKNDVSKENANKDPRQFFTMRDLVAGETCKKIYKDFTMDKKLLKLHNKGAIHVHDLDYRAMRAMTNCCLLNLKDMLENGTCIQGKLIHDIHSLQVAVTVTTQIIAAVGSSQYGGISINMSHLSPFVARSKEKYEKIFDTLPDKEVWVKKFLRKEIVDAMQTFQYQLNSLTTTNGQSPFITVVCYTNDDDDVYKDYTAILIEEFLKQRIKGMEGPNGNNINPSFPKIVYILAENNMEKGSKYYYLTELAAECTSKRMVPDYMSEKISREYKDGRVIPCMGCRSLLGAWKDKDGKYKEWGRFNIGVMSINLPYLALESKTLDEFLKKLDDTVDYLSEQQHKVYKTICDSVVDVAPILWMYGGFTRAKSGTKIGDVIPKGYCSASIGYTGLAETVYRFGVEYPTKEGQELGLMIMKRLHDRVDENSKRYELALSIYGTPSENTTTTFANSLKKFKRMEHVNDKPYVTNSYHIPVWYPIDGFKKIDFEAPFQEYSAGGW